MGCRGYASRTLIAYLRGIGLSAAEIKRTTKELEAAAESASSWIWQASHISASKAQPKWPLQLLVAPRTIYSGSGSVV